MSEDPKYTIKKIVDDITVKKDDDTTDADIIFLYKDGPEYLKELFDDYDVIVTFGDAKVKPLRYMQDKPGHHPEAYPVHVLTINKHDSDYSLLCTADKMQNKMKAQMRSVIEAAAQSSTYTLRIIDEVPGNRRVGGLKVWETTYYVKYTDK